MPNDIFTAGGIEYRFRPGSGMREPIVRAAGLRPDRIPKIVDATAGLGRDAFLLASMGAEVTLIERVPEVYELLSSNLASAAEDPEMAPIVDRMRLILGDAREILPSLHPEVVLIDPMHPERKKSALVKKQMRQLRELAGANEDAPELIRAALDVASNRVVVKWPRQRPLPEGLPKPSHQIVGKTIRYDVFVRG